VDLVLTLPLLLCLINCVAAGAAGQVAAPCPLYVSRPLGQEQAGGKQARASVV
jgi:hypothetical protein